MLVAFESFAFDGLYFDDAYTVCAFNVGLLQDYNTDLRKVKVELCTLTL